jgi:hypothetical protein
MKHPIATLGLVVAALFNPASASASEGGSCHFHGTQPAPAATVTGCATQRKTRLIEQGKLASSWGQVPATIETVEGKKGKEWRVSFKNTAIQEPAKQTLYMFFTPVGNFIAANFTGQ